MKKMNKMMKMMFVGMMMLTSTAIFAEEENVTSEVDTTYIKLDENLEPINYVNWTKEDLVAAVGELETILETDEFQLYSAGDYTYKIEGGLVTSMAIQIEDTNNDKVIYNKILNAGERHPQHGWQLLPVCQLPGAVRRLRGLREAHLLCYPLRYGRIISISHDNTNPPFGEERGIFFRFSCCF